jgi:MinD-like ATPase involved in chromosome partitioning or flagellar assembly
MTGGNAMAEWQMSSWQPVRPAEPGEDDAPTAPPQSTASAETRAGAETGTGAGTGASQKPDVSEPDASPWQRRAEAPSEKPKAVPSAKTVPSEKAVASEKAAPTEESGSPVEPASAGPRTGGFRSIPVPMPPASTTYSAEPPPTPPDLGTQGQLPPVASASASDLTNALLVRQVSPPPVSGWRKWVYDVTLRRVNLGNSHRDERLARLSRQAERHLVGCYRISVLSLKGGVGKTTTTASLGSTFASIRGDRVIAVDANPDRGTLSQKVPLETPATVRNMLRDIEDLNRYSDVRAYTSQNAHRLEVLASDTDPAVSEAFSGQDYDTAVELLEKFYSIVLTDCGTGLMHSAMNSILAGSDALVVVSSGSVDGARSASATLDWLDAHGHSELVRSSVAVVNAVRPRAGKVDLGKVVEHFEQRCRQVVLIPFDPHLEEGAEIDLNRLKSGTRAALLELAAAVASGFPSNRPEDLQRAHESRTR